jgi:hypothetical protein
MDGDGLMAADVGVPEATGLRLGANSSDSSRSALLGDDFVGDNAPAAHRVA